MGAMKCAHSAPGGNMTVKLKDLKVLPPDHKIYKESFKTYSVNTSEQKSKNSKKVELIKVTKQMSLAQIKTNLLKALKRQKIKVASAPKQVSTNPPYQSKT